MFAIGDVIKFRSDVVGKKKYHLCISFDNHFLFINSPKNKQFLGDYTIRESDITGVPKGEHKFSVISCNLVLQYSDQDLRDMRATKIGTVKPEAIRGLLVFVEELTTLTADTKNAIMDGLGDWV